MKKIYYLSSCNTCKRILKELSLSDEFIKQDIKVSPLTEKEIEKLYVYSKSYEALINKRAQMYRKIAVKTKNLNESDYKKLLLKHYTFLKRPVLINDSKLFIGNSKKVVAAAIASLK